MRVLLFTMVSVVQGLTASLAPVQRHSSAVDGMHLRLVVPVACHLVHATLLELLGRDAHLPVRARAVVAQRNLQDDNHGNCTDDGHHAAATAAAASSGTSSVLTRSNVVPKLRCYATNRRA